MEILAEKAERAENLGEAHHNVKVKDSGVYRYNIHVRDMVLEGKEVCLYELLRFAKTCRHEPCEPWSSFRI